LGIKLTTVSYRGTGPAMNDLLGGQIDTMATRPRTHEPDQGRPDQGLRGDDGRAHRGPARLPTLDEAGLKGFEVSAWHALWAPKGTPKEAIDKLTAALQTALKDAKVIERFRGPRHRAGRNGESHARGAQGAARSRSCEMGKGDQGGGG